MRKSLHSTPSYRYWLTWDRIILAEWIHKSAIFNPSEGRSARSHVCTLFLESLGIDPGDEVEGVHVAVHAHGNAFLKDIMIVLTILPYILIPTGYFVFKLLVANISWTQTWSEDPRDVPGDETHFLKHLSVTFWNMQIIVLSCQHGFNLLFSEFDQDEGFLGLNSFI